MRRNIITVVSIITAGLFATVPLYAQWGRGAQGPQHQYDRMYDTNTVETIEGTVTDVNYRSGKIAGVQGVEITVTTAGAELPVHLGPAWFVEQQEPISAGDKVTVTGSRITFEGASVLIAAEVRRDDMTLRLRDRQGFPVWRGWRMNRRAN